MHTLPSRKDHKHIKQNKILNKYLNQGAPISNVKSLVIVLFLSDLYTSKLFEDISTKIWHRVENTILEEDKKAKIIFVVCLKVRSVYECVQTTVWECWAYGLLLMFHSVCWRFIQFSYFACWKLYSDRHYLLTLHWVSSTPHSANRR